MRFRTFVYECSVQAELWKLYGSIQSLGMYLFRLIWPIVWGLQDMCTRLSPDLTATRKAPRFPPVANKAVLLLVRDGTGLAGGKGCPPTCAGEVTWT